MLLECENCGKQCKSLAKIPCGFYIEVWEEKLAFTMPQAKEAYSSLCLDCIIGENEKELQTE
jgi:hypothetical protein